MLEQKFKKLIAGFPNLVDGRFVMSQSQAEQLIRDSNWCPPLEQIVKRAKKRSDLPDSAWEPFDRLVEKEHSTLNRRNTGVGVISKGMCRGIVAIAALVAFITFFFTVTSTGKAWAKQLYNFILTVRDGGYTISPEVPYDFPAVDYEEKHYSSYEEFEKDTGYKAYKFKNTLGLPVEDIMAVKSNSGFSLYTTFILSDGNRICIYQHWQITSEYFGSVSDCEQEWTHKLSDGNTLNCFIDSTDGFFLAVSIIDDSLITIIADDGVDYSYYIFEDR